MELADIYRLGHLPRRSCAQADH